MSDDAVAQVLRELMTPYSIQEVPKRASAFLSANL